MDKSKHVIKVNIKSMNVTLREVEAIFKKWGLGITETWMTIESDTEYLNAVYSESYQRNYTFAVRDLREELGLYDISSYKIIEHSSASSFENPEDELV